MATLRLTDGVFAHIDDIDLHEIHQVRFSCGLIWEGRIPQLTWRQRIFPHTSYVTATLHGTLELRLHRAVMNAKSDEVVDHIDHDGLNNSRSNLRIVTAQQNSANRRKSTGKCRFKGVSIHGQTGKYEAYIRCNRIKKHLGLFDSEEDAAEAYNHAALSMWGNVACLNVI